MTGIVGKSRVPSFWTRRRIRTLSRVIICLVVVGALGTLFFQPPNLGVYILDIVLRIYLLFVGCVMAHEASHGHLGQDKAANFWWGRLALVPTTVPYVSFRKTHHLHHAHTNIPGEDPDHFIKPRNFLEMPLRCLALPHHWFVWLWKSGRMKRQEVAEWGLNYVVMFALYGSILALVGPIRLFWGMVPALVGVSILLWYPFAIKTHEGFSTGSEETRSHNYYGRWAYWFSLGLSMHRVHHMDQKLTWLELRDYIEEAPGGFWPRFTLRRDVLCKDQSTNDD